jgi:hypothetical protein
MDQAIYQRKSQLQRRVLFTLAAKASEDAPVYSGDIALALQLRHRFVKDQIEAFYPALRCTYGREIWVERHKRSWSERQMNGYTLPLRAALQVLCPYLDVSLFAEEKQAAIIHAIYGRGSYRDTLN